MTIELLIDLVELALKIIMFVQVTIFFRRIYYIMADTEKVLDGALADLGIGEVKPVVEEAAASSGHRETLVGLSQSGLLQKIGIRKTESQVVSMTDSEVEKTFSEYQRRYTACVADDVVNNILYGYAAFCHWLFPATAKDQLARELSGNFVINAEIKKQLGQWGLAMSPLLAIANTGVITPKNINFNPPKPPKLTETSPVELVEVVTTSHH